MKIINESIKIARELFPAAHASRKGYRTYHFCFAWDKNRLLAIGQNYPDKPSAKAMKFAKKFQDRDKMKYPYLCAETDCLSKMYGRYYIGPDTKVVVIRLNSRGELQNSKPCRACDRILRAFDTEVWYSTASGKIVRDGR